MTREQFLWYASQVLLVQMYNSIWYIPNYLTSFSFQYGYKVYIKQLGL